MEDFFTGLTNVYSSYTAEQSEARDYNLSMAKLSNPTPPTESRSLDTAVNNTATANEYIYDNQTLIYAGVGVVGITAIILALK